MSKPKYKYERHRGIWAVYRMEYGDSTSSGIKIQDCVTMEEAIEVTYNLNGWQRKKQPTL